MQVQVGPVSPESVMAWVSYARTVLATVSTSDPTTAAPTTVSPDVAEGFERYLAAWEAQASRAGDFVWTADVDPEEVEFLAHTWFTLAARLTARGADGGPSRPRLPERPAASEEFYQSLVAAMLDALAQEGRSLREFAEQLRDDWPGLQDR